MKLNLLTVVNIKTVAFWDVTPCSLECLPTCQRKHMSPSSTPKVEAAG